MVPFFIDPVDDESAWSVINCHIDALAAEFNTTNEGIYPITLADL